MHIDVFVSHPCGDKECGLVKRIRELPGLGSVSAIEDLSRREHGIKDGVVLIVHGGTRLDNLSFGRSDAALEQCGQVLREIVLVSKDNPQVRAWPIVLVSP